MKHFLQRIKKTQVILQKDSSDALLITDNSNIFYLSGLSEFPENERDCRMLITQKNAYIFTDFRYKEAVLNKASFLSLIEISHFSSFIEGLRGIIQKERLTTIEIEGGSMTVSEEHMLSDNFPSQKFLSVEKSIQTLRNLKDTFEIENIKNACSLTDAAFDFIVRHVKGGVVEKEIAWEIEKFIKEHKGELAFPPIVAFGQNSAIPHHSPTDKALSLKDTVVLLDFGAKVGGYSSDMTRTFFVSPPKDPLEKAYKNLLSIQKEAIVYAGNYNSDSFKTSRIQKNADEKLQELGFAPIPHAIGHGVGIDVHETPILSPFSENGLEKNMVVTIEPGIYIPGEFGIRIEDTILLGKKTVSLTNSPKDLLCISLPR